MSFLAFLKSNKKWILIPGLVALAVLGLLLWLFVFTGDDTLAPFTY